MSGWINRILRAKKAFDKQDYRIALALNYQALELAKEPFEKHDYINVEQRLSSVMVSYFSLADCYIGLRDYDNADRMFQQNLGFLKQLSQLRDHLPGLESAIFMAANKLKVEFYSFKKCYLDDMGIPSIENEFMKSTKNYFSSKASVSALQH
jgi:tetratricopeptide (TPR) repeat protein